jgi:hypothetical protein
MASASKPKLTEEERLANQGGASYQGAPGQDLRIIGGVSGSGLNSPQSNGLNLRDYRVDDRGRLVINPGVEEYQWNEKLKRYDAAPGRGRGYLIAEKVQAPAAAEGGPGGGTGIVPKAMDYKPEPLQVYDDKFNAPLTTDQILGSTKKDMLDWRPVSNAGNGAGPMGFKPDPLGVQQMNPLVDPNKWMYQGVGPAARKMTLIPI